MIAAIILFISKLFINLVQLFPKIYHDLCQKSGLLDAQFYYL